MDQLWHKLETLFRSWTGMQVPDTMRPAAQRMLEHMAEDAGSDPLTVLRSLDNDRERRQELIDAVGLGTTWFMREREGLSALVDNLVRATSKGEVVTVWSAGCSSGEEPYTLAMALYEAGLRGHILATDINRRSLRRGFDGIYSRRAVERLPIGWRARHLEALGPNAVRVCEHIRRMVTFELHNLRNDARLPSGWNHFDAVVCRNVLIYFERDEAITLIERLSGHCRPGGYLLLSAVERPLFWMTQVASNTDHNELIQIPEHRQRSSTNPPVHLARSQSSKTRRAATVSDGASRSNPTPTPIPVLTPTPTPTPAPALAQETPASDGDDSAQLASLLTRAETAEEAGAYADALVCAEKAVHCAPLSGPAHLTRGLLLKQLGRVQDAIDAFRAARFLDGRAWLAPYQLARCLEHIGEPKEAEEAYRHALGVLEGRGPAGLFKPSVAVDNLAATAAEVCRSRLGNQHSDE